jgi:hypothetical protein
MRRWLRTAFPVQPMRERRVLWHSLPEGPLESRCVLIIHLSVRLTHKSLPPPPDPDYYFPCLGLWCMISLLRAYACLEALHTVCVSDDIHNIVYVCMHLGHKSVCRKKSTETDGEGAERRDSQSGFSGSPQPEASPSGPQCTTLVSLYVYDLSQGFAKRMSQSLLGKQVSWRVCVGGCLW